MEPRHDLVELPVYTSIFRLRRRLYRVYDIDLPVPVSLAQVVAFGAAFLVVLSLARVAGVEPSAGSAWLYVVPPGGAAWLVNRPISDGRSLWGWTTDHLRYVVEPRVVAGGRPVTDPAERALRLDVWERTRGRRARRPEAGPA